MSNTIEIPPSGTISRVEQKLTLIGVYPRGTKFVNLTPHTLNVHTNADGEIELFAVEYGEVTFPPEREEGTVFIVSGMVNDALPDERTDITSPGELIRDADGKPIGCKGLRK